MHETRWNDADQAWDRCVQEAEEMMAWAATIKPGTVFKIIIHPAVLAAMRRKRTRKEKGKKNE